VLLRHWLAVIATTFVARLVQANDLQQLYELALTRDATLQAAKFERDAAIEARPQAQSQWLPQISANASAERERALLENAQVGGTPEVNNCVPFTSGMERCYANARTLSVDLSQTLWSYQAFNQLKEALEQIGIFLNWPLSRGGAIASAIRRARASYHQAEADLDAAERTTERQTRAAFRGMVTGVQRITAARRAAQSGRIAVDACRRNVDFGTGTEFDLLNAQNNYYAAVRAYNQARYDYLTSALTLKRQAGQLSGRDLNIVDALLVQGAP
jgi:outer membrane protein TolC